MIDVLLLLALPASGKSEVRRYLASLDAAERRGLGLGELVQLDDFPYVFCMRRVDEALAALGRPRAFFLADDGSLRDGRDWGTLVQLLDEDYAHLAEGRPWRDDGPALSAARWMLDRFDAARRAVALPPLGFSDDVRAAVERAIEPDCGKILADLERTRSPSLAGKTVILEMSRGGPALASMPLPAPLGYRYSLSRLSPAILERAAILYIAVTPEESRRKNASRADPKDPGSILNHGVPESVMRNDYGSDDFPWLLSHSGRPDAARIETDDGRIFDVPAASFDNQVDRTSFLRGPVPSWKEADLGPLRTAMRAAFATLARGSSTPG